MSETDWAEVRHEFLGEFAPEQFPPDFELPALPHAVSKFIEKANSDGATLRELSRIVETDTGLTVEVLRHVNSSFFGLRQRVKTVQQALAMLGLRKTKSLLLTTGMQAAVRARKSRMINQACFWNASLQKALFAREVAELLGTDGDTAFAGALLQDYLLPVLTNDLYEHYVTFAEQREQGPECITEFEDRTFGWNHALAGAWLAAQWQLPDDLVCCILLHHHSLRPLADPRLRRSPAAAVALSALLPDQLRQHFRGLEQLVMLGHKWPAFDLCDLLEKVDAAHANDGLGVRNDFPLMRRCKPILDRLLAEC